MADNNLFKKGVPVCGDAYLLKVSKDKLNAVIVPKDKNAPDISDIDIEKLKEEIKEQEVIFGILPKPVPKGNGMFLVAKGKAAENGENAKFKTHVKPAIVRAPKSRTPGKDKVDYRELGSIVNVPKDKLLLEKINATLGIKGTNVLGQEIIPKPGKDINMKVGQGVSLSDDGMKAVSLEEGKFMLADGKASVLTEHTVSGDVDLTTGNLAFVGKLLNINGRVLPGFKVKCKQDIYIAQGVENAEVIAGGNLEIKGGIIGSELVLKSWGNATADFVENIGRIEVLGNLTITDTMIQAKVMAGKNVTVLQGKGHLIGGELVIGGSVYVKDLGSDAEVVTVVGVGINPELEEKKIQLAKDKAIWPERMSEILKSTTSLKKMQKEEGANFPAEKAELLKKLNEELPVVMENVNQITVREEQMEEEIAKTVDECVYIYGTVYPGVRVNIGGQSKVFISEEHSVIVYFDKQDRKVKSRPMSAAEKGAIEAG